MPEETILTEDEKAIALKVIAILRDSPGLPRADLDQMIGRGGVKTAIDAGMLHPDSFDRCYLKQPAADLLSPPPPLPTEF